MFFCIYKINALCNERKCRQCGWIGSPTSPKMEDRQIRHLSRVEKGPATLTITFANSNTYTYLHLLSYHCIITKIIVSLKNNEIKIQLHTELYIYHIQICTFNRLTSASRNFQSSKYGVNEQTLPSVSTVTIATLPAATNNHNRCKIMHNKCCKAHQISSCAHCRVLPPGESIGTITQPLSLNLPELNTIVTL